MWSVVAGMFACVFACVGAATVVAPGRLAAQALSGRVVDGGTGRPVPGVPVRLLRAAPGAVGAPADTTPVASGVTAADGVFVLAAPEPGAYQVRIGAAFTAPAITLASPDSLDQREYRLVTSAEGVAAPDAPIAGPLGVCARTPRTTSDTLARRVAPPCNSRVEKQAAAVPGTLRAAYPSELRAETTGAHVVAQFVVDTVGRADMHTFRVLETNDFRFVPSVRRALAAARFYPASVAGRPVRQLVQLPFTFTLAGGPSWPNTSSELRPLFPPPFKPLPPATGWP